MAASTAGNSGKPLGVKLGVPSQGDIFILAAPLGYLTLLKPLPKDTSVLTAISGEKSRFIQFFTTEYRELVNQFPGLKDHLVYDGQLWVCWPKKSSVLATDLTENIVREVGLENGLVDVKIAAINDQWSGLKFVYRLKDRK